MKTKYTQSEEKTRKKKIIIIMVIIVLLLIIFMLFVGIKAGSWFYGVVQNYNTSQEENVNTLYIGNENKQNEEADNILMVELDGKNDQNNESNVTNEVNQNIVEEPKTNSKPVNAPYYIKVNCEANVVTVYKKDSSGKYTVPIRAMVCSIGTATPLSGVYPMTDKYTWRLLEGNVYGQYACRITGSILFHSVPYVQKDKSTLEWWEYDKLGTKASLGCVRLTVTDAKWIYDNCIPGTKIEFYSSSNPGPLGKPTAQKITADTGVRNWDPTDPDENNPWKSYVPNKESENSDTQNNVDDVNKKTEEDVTNNNILNENIVDIENNLNTANNIVDNGLIQNEQDNIANDKIKN